MSSIRTIASMAVSAVPASLFVASLFAASLIAAEAAAAKTDSGLTVKDAPAATVPGRKTCEDLKAEIDGKLQAKGVKAYTLGIVPAADVKTEKIVGSCEAGAKKITYKRG